MGLFVRNPANSLQKEQCGYETNIDGYPQRHLIRQIEKAKT